MALSDKQAIFVEEYLSCFNATHAALKAGYSPKSAYAIGHETLKKLEVAEAIKQRLSATVMSADEALMRLAEQARADIGPYIDNTGNLDVRALKSDGKTCLIKKIVRTQRRRIAKDQTEIEDTTLTVELYDAQAALELIGRHHGLFTKGEAPAVDINVNVSTESLRSRVSSIATRLRAGSGTEGDSTDKDG